jgi:hypothetical protein
VASQNTAFFLASVPLPFNILTCTTMQCVSDSGTPFPAWLAVCLLCRCVYSIQCECSRSYTGKTGRRLAVRLCERKHNLKDGLLEDSELAQHACKEEHRNMWHEARILDTQGIGPHSVIVCLTNRISQPSLDIIPIWIPLTIDAVITSKRSPCHDRFPIGLYV